MWFLTLVGKNVLRRKTRSLLSCIGVAGAVAAAIALLGISDSIEGAFSRMYEERGVDVVVLKSGVADQISSRVDGTLADRLLKIPGVAAVAPYLFDMISFEKENVFGVMVFGRNPDDILFSNLTMVEGNSLKAETRGSLLLGRILAKNLGKHAGDVVTIEGEEFAVAGIYESSNVYENGSVILTLRDMQRVMLRPNEVTGFGIALERSAKDRDAVHELRETIENLRDEKGRLLGLAALSVKDYASSRVQVRAAHAVAWAVSVVAVVMCALTILNTMSMSVFERAREIGVLRAVGWSKTRVFGMIFAESVLLILAGAAAGTILGIAMVAWISTTRHSSGYVSGAVEPVVILKGWILTMCVGILGGVYPAYYAVRLMPTEAIRHE